MEKCFISSFSEGSRVPIRFTAFPTTTLQMLSSIYWPEKSIIHTQLYLWERRQTLSGGHSQEFLPLQRFHLKYTSPDVYINIHVCFLPNRSASEGRVPDIEDYTKCNTSFTNASPPAAIARGHPTRGSAAEQRAWHCSTTWKWMGGQRRNGISSY